MTTALTTVGLVGLLAAAVWYATVLRRRRDSFRRFGRAMVALDHAARRATVAAEQLRSALEKGEEIP